MPRFPVYPILSHSRAALINASRPAWGLLATRGYNPTLAAGSDRRNLPDFFKADGTRCKVIEVTPELLQRLKDEAEKDRPDESCYDGFAKEWQEDELSREFPHPFLPLNIPEETEWRCWGGKNISFKTPDEFRQFCALGGFEPEGYVPYVSPTAMSGEDFFDSRCIEPYPGTLRPIFISDCGVPETSNIWKSKGGDAVMENSEMELDIDCAYYYVWMRYFGATGPKDKMTAMFEFLHKSGGWGELEWGSRGYT